MQALQDVPRRTALGGTLTGLAFVAGALLPSWAGARPPDEVSRSLREVAELVEPSVVRVEARGRRPGEGEFEFEVEVQGTLDEGSGWIHDRAGHVVTSHRLVAGAESVVVRTRDGVAHVAELVGSDPSTDVALLAIEARSLLPATVELEPVEPGEIVFVFEATPRSEHRMRQAVFGSTDDEGFLRTEAATHPGDPGAPWTDVHGRVIGMRSALAGGSGGALPAATLEPVVRQLLEHGEVRRGSLGLRLRDEPELLHPFGGDERGVLIEDVLPGGAAAAAGLRRGDVVLAIDGHAVDGADELRRRVDGYRPASSVQLDVLRDGERSRRELVLGESPSATPFAGGREGAEPDDGDHDDTWYAPLLELGFLESAGLTPPVDPPPGAEAVSGVLVLEVRRRSVAAREGIRSGAIVTEVGDTLVTTPEELARELERQGLERGVRLTVRSGGRSAYVFVRRPD